MQQGFAVALGPSENIDSPFLSPHVWGPGFIRGSLRLCVCWGGGFTLTRKLTSSNFKLNISGSFHDDRALQALSYLLRRDEEEEGRCVGWSGRGGEGRGQRVIWTERGSGAGGGRPGRMRELLLLHVCVFHEWTLYREIIHCLLFNLIRMLIPLFTAAPFILTHTHPHQHSDVCLDSSKHMKAIFSHVCKSYLVKTTSCHCRHLTTKQPQTSLDTLLNPGLISCPGRSQSSVTETWPKSKV